LALNAVLAASFRQNNAGTVDVPKPKAIGHPLDRPFRSAHFKSNLNIRCSHLIRGGSNILLSDRPSVPLQSIPWPSTSPSEQEKVIEGLP
jgi:hypothetical protein